MLKASVSVLPPPTRGPRPKRQRQPSATTKTKEKPNPKHRMTRHPQRPQTRPWWLSLPDKVVDALQNRAVTSERSTLPICICPRPGRMYRDIACRCDRRVEGFQRPAQSSRKISAKAAKAVSPEKGGWAVASSRRSRAIDRARMIGMVAQVPKGNLRNLARAWAMNHPSISTASDRQTELRNNIVPTFPI